MSFPREPRRPAHRETYSCKYPLQKTAVDSAHTDRYTRNMRTQKINYYRQRVYATKNACVRLAMDVERAKARGTMTPGLEIRYQRTCEALAKWEAKLEAERFRAPEGFVVERATGKSDGLPRYRLVRTDGTVFADWSRETTFVRLLNQLHRVEADLQEVCDEA